MRALSFYFMCVRWVEYSQMMQDLELGIPTQQSELDLPHNVRDRSVLFPPLTDRSKVASPRF
ncbi:hypothetical protein MESS4_p20081 [Mesorhizobium sp. STM 4661]|nr:hypothetical protein MESS4_p20081 [Mesorhizobium sp. STM 4661]